MRTVLDFRFTSDRTDEKIGLVVQTLVCFALLVLLWTRIFSVSPVMNSLLTIVLVGLPVVAYQRFAVYPTSRWVNGIEVVLFGIAVSQFSLWPFYTLLFKSKQISVMFKRSNQG